MYTHTTPHTRTHPPTRRLLAAAYLSEDFFDLVDVDAFGSDTSWLAAALGAMRFGGLLYITSTDGLSSGGARARVRVCARARVRACACVYACARARVRVRLCVLQQLSCGRSGTAAALRHHTPPTHTHSDFLPALTHTHTHTHKTCTHTHTRHARTTHVLLPHAHQASGRSARWPPMARTCVRCHTPTSKACACSPAPRQQRLPRKVWPCSRCSHSIPITAR
jgi:hypothetical protein